MLCYCRVHGLYDGMSECVKCARDASEALYSLEDEELAFGGCDPGKFHDAFAFVLLKVRRRRAKVVLTKTWNNTDYHVIVPEICEKTRKYRVKLLAVDATNNAAISEMFSLRGVMVEDVKFGSVVEYTNPLGEKERAPVKQAMVEFARLCFQEGRVDMPSRGAELLVQQLKEQEIDIAKTNITRDSARIHYRHPDSSHDDLAWAFLMSLYISRPWLVGNGLWASPLRRYRR